ncbi:UDP-Gal or UDP-GlcNAc-dependent glycosyltransferase [Trypanosoma rangeli SC58]|uniref:Hexosyltransferase n=3 Tax=Trypanosoma rangeli SC58 TaxID=429131 RepID=A0A061IXW9_TRYRA|nr:UDP-Gal or UDP-GlcNAc-dependent glycosyltransferase [Trypanosoma rangeli SC58]
MFFFFCPLTPAAAMPKRRLLTTKGRLKRVVLLLLLFIAATTLLLFSFDTAFYGAAGPHSSGHPRTAAADDTALAYIPRSVVDTWGRRHYLIVLGVPSVDDEVKRRRRNLQRSTCWRFPGVATRANDFSGAMLVLYVLGRHPAHGYNYSAALQEEAAQWHDVVALPMNEGRVTTRKTGDDDWGIEVAMAVSRKTYMWFDLALRLFPTASYIAKGDDDIFLQVPRFLVNLRLLPRRGIYMGSQFLLPVSEKDESNGVFFMIGWCYTLSRDLAEALVSYKPLERLVYLPYSKEQEDEIFSINMDHEDIMVGRVLLQEVKPPSLVNVRAFDCLFGNIRNATGHSQVVPSSICIHHVREEDYAALMARFGHDTSPFPLHVERISKELLHLLCD